MTQNRHHAGSSEDALRERLLTSAAKMDQPSQRYGPDMLTLNSQQPGDFADYAGLVKELANGNVASVINMLPWSELTDKQRELAQIRIELAVETLGAPCNNRLGLIRECGRVIMAADELIGDGGRIDSLDDYDDMPLEVQKAVVLADAGDGDAVTAALENVKAQARAEAREHQRWIVIAKERGCYTDFTSVKDRIRRAVESGERLAPESFVDELDFYSRRLIAMCKVAESGEARPYIIKIFQRRGTSSGEDRRPRERGGIFGRRGEWED